MVLPMEVSLRMGVASRQRFGGFENGRCATKLRLSAAMVAQMVAQTWGQPQAVLSDSSAFRPRNALSW